MRVVIALGGNALLPRGTPPDEQPQLDQVTHVAPALARVAEEHAVVLVHGNGPQVGLLALESAADASLTRPYPLDDLVAETQGLIGYWLQRALARHLQTPVVTLVTQTVVDPGDPAFATPSKFVGSTYDEDVAAALATEHGWTMARDGSTWRRVVASPLPLRIVEAEIAEDLLRRGTTVILAGGGGVPVVETDLGLAGVEAVVDKDLAAARIAVSVGADVLLVLTDVANVMRDFGTPRESPLGVVTVEELEATPFAAGSMGPKVAAVCDFVRRTGRRAAIGSLTEAASVLSGLAGTQVRR